MMKTELEYASASQLRSRGHLVGTLIKNGWRAWRIDRESGEWWYFRKVSNPKR
jgi:hypothetical protein